MEQKRCAWCGRETKDKVVRIPDMGVTFFPVCSDSCESKIANFLGYYRKTKWCLALGMLALAVAAGITSVLGVVWLLPLYLGVFGGLIIAFPFVTLETIKLFGLHKSILFTRIVGIATITYSSILTLTFL